MRSLTRQLAPWRAWEAAGAAGWGFAVWTVVVGTALAVACGIDWWVDLRRDTPFGLRVLLTVSQLALAGLTAAMLLVRLRVPSADALAARAEAADPAYGHTLVTALQLTRPGAKTDGMSAELIAAVAKEAGELAAAKPVTRFFQARRIVRAVGVLAVLAMLGSGFVAVRPALAAALIARQCLLNVEIPRTVRLTADTAEVWPVGEEVTLRVLADGRFPDAGTVTVQPDGQPGERFPLALAETLPDGRGVFTATLPPTSVGFHYSARVGDGRTHAPGTVRFEARPVVGELAAWVVLPKWVDPDGKREYRRFQSQAEVQALPDCEVEVRATLSKPVASAAVGLLGTDGKEFQRLPMTLSADRAAASVRFQPPAAVAGYRVLATDEYGFDALNPPRRGMIVLPDPAPTVTLLSEVLKDPKEDGPLDDYDVSGMPLRVGGQVQVGYTARSPYGLSRAFVVYRVQSGDEVGPWVPLPLANTTADENVVGPFLPALGVFRESGPFGQVEFYRLPSADPDTEPPGLAAGGRYNFQAARLRKSVRKGGEWVEAPLSPGDRVDFRVAVFDRHPGAARSPTQPPADAPVSGDAVPQTGPPDPRRAGGWSPVRSKLVVSDAEFEEWRQRQEAFRGRLAELESKQKQVFPQKTDGP
ncbi:MAG: hypothetical protein U0871_05145 [Gemmataceae bacterium]